MKQSRVLVVVASVVVALAAGSCSSDSKKSDDTTTTSTFAPRSTPGCKSTENTTEQRMTVEPCEALTDGQVVKAYVTGYAPGAEIAVTQCAAAADVSGSQCDAGALSATVGEGGSVVVDFPVKQVLESQTPVDCGTTACVLGVGQAGGADRADPVAITFAP